MPTDSIIIRNCAICHESKPLSEFHKNSQQKYGRDMRCRSCRSHKGNSPTFTEAVINRFWSHVDKTPGQGPNGGCWEWKASRDRDGYGQFGGVKWSLRAHRYSWLPHHPNDVLTPKDHVAHHCDNPPCVRPDHHFKTDNSGNMQDMVKKGRYNSGYRPGENHILAKITEADVSAIRSRYAAGGISQSALGSEYGLTQSYVSEIIRFAKWSHII